MNRQMSNAIMFPSAGNDDIWENSPNVSGIFRTSPVGPWRASRVSRGFAAGGNVQSASGAAEERSCAGEGSGGECVYGGSSLEVGAARLKARATTATVARGLSRLSQPSVSIDHVGT